MWGQGAWGRASKGSSARAGPGKAATGPVCRRPEAGISLTHEWLSPDLSPRWSPAPALGDLGLLSHCGPDVGGVFTLCSSSLDLHSRHFQG